MLINQQLVRLTSIYWLHLAILGMLLLLIMLKFVPVALELKSKFAALLFPLGYLFLLRYMYYRLPAELRALEQVLLVSSTLVVQIVMWKGEFTDGSILLFNVTLLFIMSFGAGWGCAKNI